jgi:hypothetical protein
VDDRPYNLRLTEEYQEELQVVCEGSGLLEQQLEESFYFMLRKNPRLGKSVPGTQLWWKRRRILDSVLMVDIYYRIYDEDRTVVLVSIRYVDPTKM